MDAGYFLFSRTRFFVGQRVTQWFALRLEVAQFDPEKIVFAQGEGHLLGRPVEQLQQLLVGQQMPVALDNGDIGSPSLIGSDARGFFQPHRAADPQDFRRFRAHYFGKSFDRDQRPVAPDEGVQAIWEMGEIQSNGRSPFGQIRGKHSWAVLGMLLFLSGGEKVSAKGQCRGGESGGPYKFPPI